MGKKLIIMNRIYMKLEKTIFLLIDLELIINRFVIIRLKNRELIEYLNPKFKTLPNLPLNIFYT